MSHKKIIIAALLIGLVIAGVTNYFSISHYVCAQPAKTDTIQPLPSTKSFIPSTKKEIYGDRMMTPQDDYWKGRIDEKLATQVETNRQMIAKLDSIETKIGDICKDIVNVQISAAKNSGIYGTGAAVGVYLAILFIQFLIKKKPNMTKGKPE